MIDDFASDADSSLSELDECYLSILHCGLSNIRNVTVSGEQSEYSHAEAEHLHEIPTLIGEQNHLRHEHYLNGTRELYLEWVKRTKYEGCRELVEHIYQPYWERMEQIIGPNPHA